MDEMYKNNADNMEHCHYDPNLLQCECCLQKDELIDTQTQAEIIQKRNFAFSLDSESNDKETDLQELLFPSDSNLKLCSDVRETMESTSYTCDDSSNEYFHDIPIELFEQEASYQNNSNPEQSPPTEITKGYYSELYEQEESYQNNSNPEQSPPTEITKGYYSEESIYDKMLTPTQFVKMTDSSESARKREKNPGLLEEILAPFNLVTISEMRRHMSFWEMHAKVIEHNYKWNRARAATKTSSQCAYGIDKTVKNDENCVVSNIQLSETHLKDNECIRNDLKRKCEVRFSEKLPKKRIRSEDFIPIVNDLAENAKPISPEGTDDVAAIPVLC